MEKLFNDAISHWERMIAWAEKRSNEIIDINIMVNNINELWFAEDCSFCFKFGGDNFCLTCPLDNKNGCCDGLWELTCKVNTWEEWVERAKDVLNYIREKKDESISHKSR
jgi:hypothetical protein